MDTLLLLWIRTASIVVVTATITCVWLVVRLRRGPRLPLDGWGPVSVGGFGVLGLIALALGLGRVDAGWAVLCLVGVNLLIQPLCAYLFLGSAYKLVMAVFGWATYAWRRIPRDTWPLEQYQAVRWYCLSQGISACSCAGGTAWLCFAQLP